jgi:hypothetical protein
MLRGDEINIIQKQCMSCEDQGCGLDPGNELDKCIVILMKTNVGGNFPCFIHRPVAILVGFQVFQ